MIQFQQWHQLGWMLTRRWLSRFVSGHLVCWTWIWTLTTPEEYIKCPPNSKLIFSSRPQCRLSIHEYINCEIMYRKYIHRQIWSINLPKTIICYIVKRLIYSFRLRKLQIKQSNVTYFWKWHLCKPLFCEWHSSYRLCTNLTYSINIHKCMNTSTMLIRL